ncbi:MAG: hypothetical protein HYZ21_00240 [Chloroflexi bacterium]|nr:hypothetical protein [Chloroflexota bacterium]
MSKKNTAMVISTTQDLRAEVMASPAYQERTANLFELFHASRQANGDPNSLLAIQAVLAELLMNWQQKQREFKSTGDQLGIAVVRRLILILQRIADSIVWRSLGYDRVLIQLLAEHSKTGFLDNTVFKDFEEAQQIAQNEGAIVIVNDLTTTLRHGDLTVIDPEKHHIIRIKENKSGEGSSQNRRASRQKKYLNSLWEFLSTGIRISKDKTQDFLIRLDIPIQTHHLVTAEVIKRARQDGYYKTIVNDCFAIEAVGMEHPNAHFPKERPFENIEHRLSQGNLDEGLFETTATRIAPYGIFPFDDQTCFDLITGTVQLVATINFDALVDLFAQHDLALELPQLRQEEVENYLSAPINKKREIQKHSRFSWFVIRNATDFTRISPDNWGRVFLELMHEETMAHTYKSILALMKDWNISEDRTTRLYIGYKDETNIWL